jgi:hypothetical protein
MDIAPDRKTHDGRGLAKRPSPIVAWIAIVVGVTMIATGILLVLWGLSWQGAIEDADPGELTGLQGGPALLPVGILVIALGVIWILNAFRGFGKARVPMRRCPNCGKNVEPDLAFCYHCGAEIPEDRPDRAEVKTRR